MAEQEHKTEQAHKAEQRGSYRPHDPGHNYYAPGIYLITLVTQRREPLLGSLTADDGQATVALSPLGEAVMEEWAKIPAFENKKGRQVSLLAACCMPDHFHGVISVDMPLDRSLGEIIRGFKISCTKRRWRLLGKSPSMAFATTSTVARGEIRENRPLSSLSHAQRQAFYASQPGDEGPLFDDNYDDTICLDERHRQAMVRYVQDNPRRAMLRRMRPELMRRCLHLRIAGRDYAAFGNLFFLRWPRKEQVMCHRWRMLGDRRDYSTPYETTEAFRLEHDCWIADVMNGATVLVTPGISRGEQLLKNECLERGLPLIHLQKEPIGPFWKPEASRFEACANGSLLILAPWHPAPSAPVADSPECADAPVPSDYAIFHNLNALAAELCAFDGEAAILR